MHKLIPSVLGKLSLPDRGQCNIIFCHIASCNRVWKPQKGKCEKSVSRNPTVRNIYNISEVKCPFFAQKTTCFILSKPVAKSKKLHMVNTQCNTMNSKRKKKEEFFTSLLV